MAEILAVKKRRKKERTEQAIMDKNKENMKKNYNEKEKTTKKAKKGKTRKENANDKLKKWLERL